MIRCFTVKNMTSDVPLDHCEGVWRAASPKTTGNFTAVGYFFARELQKGLGVPVGIIDCSWGGTSIERWISREGIRLSPAMKEHVGTIIRLNNTYEDRLEKFVAAYAAWQEKFKRRRHDLQLQTVNEWKNVWSGPVPGNGGILLLRKKIRLDGRKTSVNIGGINAAYEVFLNGRKVAAVSFRRAIAYPWGLNFTVGEKDVKDGDNELVIRIFSSEPVTRIHGDGRLGGEWEYQYLAEFPALSPEAEKELPHFVQGTRTPRLPCSLFNGMVNPLIPYDFAGVIWYQGESNACQPQIYTEATRALVADWRRQFGRDFSFYWCQLANYQAKSVDPAHLIPVPQTSIEYFSATPYNSDWALFREAQAKALGIPGTGQAVLIDAGEADNVHPRNKQVVGWRLAALALAKDYGKKNAFSGPVYRELKVENGKIRLFFDFAESGLTARKIPEYYIVNSGRNQFLPLRRNSPGSELEGFAVAGKDGKWFWADAEIDGDTVLVWSDKVPKPTQVRYAWSNNPTCTLYNKAGLPTAPFRSNQ